MEIHSLSAHHYTKKSTQNSIMYAIFLVYICVVPLAGTVFMCLRVISKKRIQQKEIWCAAELDVLSYSVNCGHRTMLAVQLMVSTVYRKDIILR